MIPRIIKTTRSSNRIGRVSNYSNKKSKEVPTEVYEKTTVTKTKSVFNSGIRQTIPHGISPNQTRRGSNRQITVNRRIEGERGYTPIKRTVISVNNAKRNYFDKYEEKDEDISSIQKRAYENKKESGIPKSSIDTPVRSSFISSKFKGNIKGNFTQLNHK